MNNQFSRRKRSLVPILFLAVLGLSPTSYSQSVPTLINYQGQIQNPDGSPLPTADYELSFSIYDAAQGGTLIWGPQIFSGESGLGYGPKIPVVQGYFNVTLGALDTTNRSLATAFSFSTRYLEIAVSNRPPITPRQQLLSAPYALRAGDADHANTAELAQVP